MPYKERYWKNPEHHRAAANKSHRRLVALGVNRINQLSSEAQHNTREYQNHYHKTHRKEARKVEQRYRDKVKSLFGDSSDHSRWLYSLKKREEDAKKRKAQIRVATLQRKLVESPRPADMVFRRPVDRRGLLPARKVVLQRRSRSIQ